MYEPSLSQAVYAMSLIARLRLGFKPRPRLHPDSLNFAHDSIVLANHVSSCKQHTFLNSDLATDVPLAAQLHSA